MVVPVSTYGAHDALVAFSAHDDVMGYVEAVNNCVPLITLIANEAVSARDAV